MLLPPEFFELYLGLSCRSAVQCCQEERLKNVEKKMSERFIAPVLVGPLTFQSRAVGTWGALCVQMDFTRTFEANTKCNSIKYVWSHFYQLLVVLKYHRCLWNNIFDTDIFRCINTNIKGVYLAIFGIFMLLEMSVSKILFHRRLWCFRTTKIW